MAESKGQEMYQKQHKQVLELFEKGLHALAPEQALREQLFVHNGRLHVGQRNYDLSENRRIWVFGSGKAAGRMALEAERILGRRIYDGIVICPYGLKTKTRRIQQFEAAHPIPDLNSLTATYEMLDVAGDVGPEDLVLFLMSGGSSSLLCMPHDDIELDELRVLYRELLLCGLPIAEMNRIRTSFSKVKGGGLREVMGRAMVEMLVISDVPGNDPAVIGSGPLTAVPVSPAESLKVLRQHELDKRIPQSLVRFLQKQSARQQGAHMASTQTETAQSPSMRTASTSAQPAVAPDPSTRTASASAQATVAPDPSTRNASPFPTEITLLASSEKLAAVIAEEARTLGYNTFVHETFLTGEARRAARTIAARAVDVLARNEPVPRPAALIYYGETTVNVTGDGKGGRNQELALSAAIALEGQHYITLLSAGTDGRDGDTGAAGAICTAQTGLHARSLGMAPEDYLERNDSYHFFSKAGGLLVTGLTGNNLMDIHMVLVDK